MIYMSRLGIWGEGTPFRAFEDFLHAIEKRFVARRVCGIYPKKCCVFPAFAARCLEDTEHSPGSSSLD